MFAVDLLALPLFAAGDGNWLRPIYPMLFAILVGVGGVAAFNAAWQARSRYGYGPAIVVGSVIPAIAALLVVSLYMGMFSGIYLPESQQVDSEIILYSLGFVLGPCLIYGLIFLVSRKTAAVTLATAKETVWQPLYWVVLSLGLLATVAYPFVPYHTFGEDVKMLKENGLELVKILSLVVAFWTASVSVSDEVEGRTALTVLSKPVGRRHFVLGKFFGISLGVMLLFIVLTLAFLISISFKVVYDSVEQGGGMAGWLECWHEMQLVIPGLILQLMQVIVLTSISVAISTRLPMLPNLLICVSVYVLGRLVPMLVGSEVGQSEIVQFMGRLFAVILPVLDHFESSAAVPQGIAVPWTYVAWAFSYAAIYSCVAMLVALMLFEDRDLA